MSEFGDFRGAARRLEDIDLPRIGHRIGVGEDEIHAVIDVETGNGQGFDSTGRPKMLFEPHIFYREVPRALRDKAIAAGLAYPSWRRNYPANSYPRLVEAMAIDATAALRSASWGLGQVMGFNHKMAGFDTVQQMVRAFMEDEDRHLEAMVAFIQSAGLDDEIRRHDWSGFARGYNGAGYRQNQYHLKLASRFAWWQKRRDTPWEPADEPPAAVGTVDVAYSRGDKGPAVRALQVDLAAAGFYAGDLDGKFGPATEAAVRAFQASRDLLVDGWAGPKTLNALADAVTAPAAAAAMAPAKVAPKPEPVAAAPGGFWAWLFAFIGGK
ncbi:lysozyme [Aurantimonas phage AmM-1]|uniref:endolysin n=1 Tax=Aurantimonas phage AmM-1 TaxID=1503929 RepID=UPI000540FE5C|nr:endolysin [Aurantimonas phage AmM-1]BAP94485.1 lysozyme [Aurantimonas phage AmM-1]